MTEQAPRKWFQARLRWAVLKDGWKLHRWREAEHFFLSTDREAAFQEALRIGREGERWVNPATDRRMALRLHCRLAEVQYLEDLGTDQTAFHVELGETQARDEMVFDQVFDPAARVPAPLF